MIAVAIDVDDAYRARALAQAHDDVWFTAGVHPSEAGRGHDLSALATFAEDPRCVAWGEMGLDGHWPEPALEAQIDLLESQLSVVQGLADVDRPRPIVLHCRKALDHLLPVLEASGLPGERFVFHCFTDGPDEVDRVLAFGAAVSFTGVVTYRNAADVAAASDRVPLERLMVETDSPYLSPEPVRQVRPNEPAHVVHVASFLAARRGLSVAEFDARIDDTVRRVYGVG